MTHFKLRKCHSFIFIILLSPPGLALTFDTSFLQGRSKDSDLSQFYQSGDLPPGNYDVDIFVNSEWKGHFDARIVNSSNDIEIKKSEFNLLGIKKLDISDKDKNAIINLYKLKDDIKSNFDTGKMAVNLTVPQQFLDTRWNGYVDPKFWDRGIPGFLLSYQGNYYHSSMHNEKSQDSAYISLNSGLNLLGWQLRDSSVFNYSNKGKSYWDTNTRYVQRSFSQINSQLRMGESYTTSDLFDSFRFRGVSLGTDIRMFPDSLQGFAPIVHGVAATNALVKIIQNGVSIYQQTVSPGPFALRDILPTGSGGDLHVEVIEADGRIQRFTVPFSSVPDMLKPDVNVYNLTLGEVHIPGSGAHPNFFQGTWRRGMSNLFTLYAGGIGSEHYYSGLLGTGLNLPFGAVSVDATYASQLSSRAQPASHGQSYRIAYSKYFSDSGTNIAVTAYRYSTSGFLTLEDSVRSREYAEEWDNRRNKLNYSTISQKNAFNFNINQNLGGAAGSFFFSGTFRSYWGNRTSNKEYQVGYSNSFHQVTYNATVSRTRDRNDREELRYYLGLSIPFSVFETPMYLTTNASYDGHRYNNSDIGVSGSAGKGNEWNYNVDLSNSKGGETMANTNLSYRAHMSTLNASYSKSSSFSQAGLGMMGSLVAYKGGVLFANQMGDTFAIVDAPGVSNARINSDSTMVTNSAGKALMPYMSPYRKNALTVNTDAPGDDVQVLGNRKDIVPYSGSINYIRFDTDRRKSFILRAVEGNNTPLPFGTSVTDSAGKDIGYVGQGSIIYIRSDRLPEKIIVHLGNDHRTCSITHPGTNLSRDLNHCQ